MPKPFQKFRKGQNTWTRPQEASGERASGPHPINPTPLRKVGKFALVRSQGPSALHHETSNDKRGSTTRRSRWPETREEKLSSGKYKYERPLGQAARQAITSPLLETATKMPIGNRSNPPPPKRPTLDAVKHDKADAPCPSDVACGRVPIEKKTPEKPSKKMSRLKKPLSWNKYLRQASVNPSPAEQRRAVRLQSPTLKELPRRSPRLTSLAKGNNSASRVNPPLKQQSIPKKLLRLGGKLYAISGGRSRSVMLRQTPISPKINAVVGSNEKKTRTLTQASLGQSTGRDGRFPSQSATLKGGQSTEKKGTTPGGPAKRLSKSKKSPPLIYCPVYCHTGACPRRNSGCRLRHDPTKRGVCSRWLQGKCTLGKSCPLQHQRREELMPTCTHYLRGKCTKPDCPFLHKSLAPGTPSCPAFLRGYCAAGALCPMKHFTAKQLRAERKLASGENQGEKRQREGTQKEAPPKKRRGRYFDDPDEVTEDSSIGGGGGEDVPLVSSGSQILDFIDITV